MFGIGLPEALVIVFIALLLFGAERLPGAARAMGRAVEEFKKGLRESSAFVPAADDSRDNK